MGICIYTYMVTTFSALQVARLLVADLQQQRGNEYAIGSVVGRPQHDGRGLCRATSYYYERQADAMQWKPSRMN